MRLTGKIIKRRYIILLFGLLIPALAVVSIYVKIHNSWKPILHHQQTLLYKTDHRQLVEACRDLWHEQRQRNAATQPADGSLPDAISEMQPHDVSVYASGVEIEMGGQWCHYGFEVFFSDPGADAHRTVWRGVYPSRQLAPELWYYAENGIIERNAVP